MNHRTQARGRLRRWLRGGLALVAGAALVEGACALLLPRPWVDRSPLVQVEPDPAVGYRLVPDQRTFSYQAAVRTNADGLRERPLGALGGRRMLVLGGSETFGKGVAAEDTFARQLEARLSPPGAWHTVNAGAPDWTLNQSLAWLQTRGATLAPDRIILALYWDDLFFVPIAGEAASGVPREAWGPRTWARDLGLLAWLAPLYTHSRALCALRNAAKALSHRARGTAWHRWRRALLTGAREPDLERAWDQAEEGLRRARQAGGGAPVLVVLLPIEDQVGGGYPQASFQREARRRAEAAGLEVVDAGPAFERAHAAGEALFIPYDGRPTPAGHRVIADVLAEALAGYQQTPR